VTDAGGRKKTRAERLSMPLARDVVKDLAVTRIGHADVAFTMKQYVQTDLEADREVANILADLIIGGLLVTEIDDQADAPNQAEEA
jgi:hypothetical protein